MSELAVQCDTDNDSCERLAKRLQLPMISMPDGHPGLLLSFQDNRLTLSRPSDRDAGSVCVDFTDTRFTFRLAQALSREAVVKAVGGCAAVRLGDSATHHLIDATAGLGQDAFILAAAGWHVSLIEQSPVIHALLEDGLRRARESAQQTDTEALTSLPKPELTLHQTRLLTETLGRLHLCEPGDSTDILPTLAPASVIYLDPMFPMRDKSARVKKNRFLLQQLHGAEGTGQGLLPLALKLSTKVVVKRPRLAQPLDGLRPASSLTGKTSRFDIYVGQPKK